MGVTVTRQAVALGDLVGRVERLEVHYCRRRERHGLSGLAGLLDEHGHNIGLPDLAVLIAAAFDWLIAKELLAERGYP